MAEFPKKYINRYQDAGGKTLKMFLEDGTVLDENAEPISGPGFEAKQAKKKQPKRAPYRKIGLTRASETAARIESPASEEGDD
jgi:hypothetical protein